MSYYRLIWLLPVAFVAHVIEEYLTGFPAYAFVVSGYPMAMALFLGSNILFILVMAWLVGRAAAARTADASFWLLFWAAGNLFWNFIFHVVTGALFGHSPGIVSATVLYLPLFLAVSATALKEHVVTRGALARATLYGGLYMGAVAAFAIFHVQGF